MGYLHTAVFLLPYVALIMCQSQAVGCSGGGGAVLLEGTTAVWLPSRPLRSCCTLVRTVRSGGERRAHTKKDVSVAYLQRGGSSSTKAGRKASERALLLWAAAISRKKLKRSTTACWFGWQDKSHKEGKSRTPRVAHRCMHEAIRQPRKARAPEDKRRETARPCPQAGNSRCFYLTSQATDLSSPEAMLPQVASPWKPKILAILTLPTHPPGIEQVRVKSSTQTQSRLSLKRSPCGHRADPKNVHPWRML